MSPLSQCPMCDPGDWLYFMLMSSWSPLTWDSSSVILPFMTLTLLECTGQKISLNLGLFDVSISLNSSYTFLTGVSDVSLSASERHTCLKSHVCQASPLNSHYFSFVLSKLKYGNTLLFIIVFLINFNINLFFPKTAISMVVKGDWLHPSFLLVGVLLLGRVFCWFTLIVDYSFIPLFYGLDPLQQSFTLLLKLSWIFGAPIK